MTDDDQRRDALNRLPLPYSTALRLREAGIPDELIAECVGVEPEAMETLLRIAQAKLATATLQR
ncbi:MAG TPA: hypothetical protein VHI10_06935 [Mycobacterium sp.]|nr:hypothetical protein [Mycobacterium sp.]